MTYPCPACGEGEFRYPGDQHPDCVTTEIRAEWKPSYMASVAAHRGDPDSGFGDLAPPPGTDTIPAKPAGTKPGRPTNKQVRYLRWLGYGGVTPTTASATSELIQQLLARRGRRS